MSDLVKLANILKQGNYTEAEIHAATNLSYRVGILSNVIKEGKFSISDIQAARQYDQLKMQITDRLIGAIQGWPDKEVLFNADPPGPIKGHIVIAAERIANWLFNYKLLDLNKLMAAGPYYPTQQRDIPKDE